MDDLFSSQDGLFGPPIAKPETRTSVEGSKAEAVPPLSKAPDPGRFGGNAILGQDAARDRIEQVLGSGRLAHAYLITGPRGCGKTAFALAFAEWVNGVSHLTDLGPLTRSRKSGWFSHPDIHLFFPMPIGTSQSDALARRQLLADDPHAMIDYATRPALAKRPAGGTDPDASDAPASATTPAEDGGTQRGSGGVSSSSKTLRAFYSIQQYRDSIRPATRLKPNEGLKSVIILLSIDTMRAETANAFLKLLEEPSDDVLFILTSDGTDSLLPTILSRCQILRLQPLPEELIREALVERDGLDEEDARYLARLSDGNYPLARFLDAKTMRVHQEQMIEFLRASYTQDASALLDMIQAWSGSMNLESQTSLLTALERLLRDLMIYRETGDMERIIHASKQSVIRDIAATLGQARVEEMIDQIGELKPLLHQNVQFKLIMTALSLRFFHLLRGRPPVIESATPWIHLPAHVG